MEDWVEPTKDEIDQVAGLVRSNRWQNAFSHGVDDISFLDDGFVSEIPAHQTILDYWTAQKATRPDGLFTVKMVNPTEIPSILSNVMLLDIVDDGFDARYRVYGTGIVSKVGKDWSGKLVSEMNRSVRSNQALFYRGCYRAVFLENRAMFTKHQAISWLDANTWQRLILPVYTECGGSMARFLVCNIAEKGRALSAHEWTVMNQTRYD